MTRVFIAAALCVLAGCAGGHHAAAPAAVKAAEVSGSKVVSVEQGRDYVVTVPAGAKAALYGAGSGVATSSAPATFTARSSRLAVDSTGGTARVAGAPSRRLTPRPPACPTRRRPVVNPHTASADVVVVGAHSAGIGAALSAARHCLSVLLVSAERVPGGMFTAGQLGFEDGNPLFYYPERTRPSDFENEQIPVNTSWSVTGGMWKLFRSAVAEAKTGNASDVGSTMRFQPHYAATAVQKLLAMQPNVHVLYGHPVSARLSKRHVAYADIAGRWRGRVTGRYWVDGSDGGDLVGVLRLPYRMGEQDAQHPDGNGDVMAYSYRWTAVEEDKPGLYPNHAPQYYDINRPGFIAQTKADWPGYQTDFEIRADQPYAVHPFRLLNAQGRLSGNATEALGDPSDGSREPGLPPMVWDVNSGESTTAEIAQMLGQNQDATSLFERHGMASPYQGAAPDFRWANIAYVQDRRDWPAADRAALVQLIKEAVKAKALGLLWFIRSGDMENALHTVRGGKGATVRSHWSLSNQLGTPDGMPMLMYQREGRRVKAVHTETIEQMCPTFTQDFKQPAKVCTSFPRYLSDSIGVGDYGFDIHVTGNTPPQIFSQIRPHQLAFGSLIPKNTRGLLVGGAIGTDRFVFGGFRVDPSRMMTGGAIGTAIAVADRAGTDDFAHLDHRALRSALADDGQPTFFIPHLPDWSIETGWTGTALAAALQKLIAMDWVTHGWNDLAAQGPALLRPALPLTGARAAILWQGLAGKRCAPRAAPAWATGARNEVVPLAKVAGMSLPGDATVGDAYVWMANHLPGGEAQRRC